MWTFTLSIDYLIRTGVFSVERKGVTGEGILRAKGELETYKSGLDRGMQSPKQLQPEWGQGELQVDDTAEPAA